MPILEQDLVAKWDFVTRQLAWELFDRSKMIKYKFELPWKNILAMRAGIEENTRHGILEIEVHFSSSFQFYGLIGKIVCIGLIFD